MPETLGDLRGGIWFLERHSLTHHRDGAPNGFEKKSGLVKRDRECRVLTAFEREKKLSYSAITRNGGSHLPEQWNYFHLAITRARLSRSYPYATTGRSVLRSNLTPFSLDPGMGLNGMA